MGPTATNIKKQLSRKLTVMFIPHSDIRPVRVNLSISLLVFLAVGWTGLTVWSGYIASRHVDYWKAKANESVLRAKVFYFSQEMKKTREYLDRVRETELALQNLLNMKSKRAIVESDKALGGPSGLDRKLLMDVMSGRRVQPTLEDMNAQLAEMKEAQSDLISNYDEISRYIDDQRDLFRKTPMGWPAEGRLTSLFGRRHDPFRRDTGREFHQGLDIANAKGTPIAATADGVIQIASWQGGYGRLVVIDHGRGYKSYYAHNSELLVKRGDRVVRGQTIARMGSSGHSTGHHLHYEVWHKGRVVNPIKFVKGHPIE